MIDTQLIENNSGDARRIRELLCEAMWTPVNLAVADRLSIGPEHLDAHRKNLIPLDLERPQSYRILGRFQLGGGQFHVEASPYI